MAETETTFAVPNHDVKITVTNVESDYNETASIASVTFENSKPVGHSLQAPDVLQKSTNDGRSDDKGLKGNSVLRLSMLNPTNLIHKSKYNVESPENVTKLIKFYTMMMLVVVICLMITMFLVPVILYYTKQPTVDLFIIEGVNFDSCSVSKFLCVK